MIRRLGRSTAQKSLERPNYDFFFLSLSAYSVAVSDGVSLGVNPQEDGIVPPPIIGARALVVLPLSRPRRPSNLTVKILQSDPAITCYFFIFLTEIITFCLNL